MHTPGRRVVTETFLTSALNTLAARITRATDTALAGVVPAASGPLGNRWVFLGDSITAGSHQQGDQLQSDSFPLWAQLFSGGKIWMTRNSGIGGDRTEYMLARFDRDVVAARPTVVFLMAGTNDISHGVSFAQYQANIRQIVARCRAIGAAVVLSTMTPRNDAHKAAVVLRNHWLRRYAAETGLHLVDSYAAMVEPDTGNLITAYHSDGLHPNLAGRRALGQFVADEMGPYTREWAPPLLQDAAETASWMFPTNNHLGDDADADGIPDGWSGMGATTGFTHQLARENGSAFKSMRITLTGASTYRAVYRTLPADSWTVGDRLYLGGLIDSNGGVEAMARFWIIGTSTTYPTAARFTGAVTRGPFGLETVVPAGTTEIRVMLYLSAGTGSAAITQPVLMNLTRLGLV